MKVALRTGIIVFLVALCFKGIAQSGPTPVITTSTITGNILGCVGSPGESPNVGKMSVAGTSLSGDITVTPPPGFDISLTPVGGYSPSLVLKQVGGAVITIPIYIRTSVSDPAGPVSGSIQLTTPGATADVVPIAGVVNALPTVNQVQDISYNNGNTTVPINFTGTANTFTWTNDNPSIGIPASGTGDITAFIATNAGTGPIKATITVTPMSTPYAYILNNSANNISVIDTRTNTIKTTIPVGQAPFSVATSPNGNIIYVANQVSNTVSVISAANSAVTTTIPVGKNPINEVLSPDGSRLYVANNLDPSISVINTATNKVIFTITTGMHPTPTGMAISPDGNKLYVTDRLDGIVTVINTATNSIITSFYAMSQFANADVISKDGSKLYVLDEYRGYVVVINTSNYAITNRILVENQPETLAITPNGNYLYVANFLTGSISVINTVTEMVIATIPLTHEYPFGVSVTPDGSKVYVVNNSANTVSVIDTKTNQIITTIPVGPAPAEYGNFVSNGTSCPGTPITFTITVNSLSPSIISGPVSGTISACAGSASASPNIQQLTVSGGHLTGDITATAPAGFEISLAQENGFGSTLTIPQSAGAVSNVSVYVRSAASDPAGSISGNITLSSPGAVSQTVAVSGTVNALPTVSKPNDVSYKNGQATGVITFSGTGDTYTWTNDVPGIGLPASGTGNIPSFTAIDVDGDTPATATVTVTPTNSITGCTGTPVIFTITVTPSPPPAINSSATLTGLSTIYGVASPGESFTISATNLTEGILVTPPQGFEVSTDGQAFSSRVTVGQAGNINAAPIYIRLAATTPQGVYAGSIVLSSAGAGDVDLSMPLSNVERALLTITAPNLIRAFGVPNPLFVPAYSGFVNGDDQSVLINLPELTTTATISSPEGKYDIHVDGGSARNYLINPVDGTLTIVASESEIIIPNAFTPNGDGINDLWNIKKLSDFTQCLVSVYSRYGGLVFQSRGYAKPWDGTQNGSAVPAGTYYYVINPNIGGFPLLSGYVAVLR